MKRSTLMAGVILSIGLFPTLCVAQSVKTKTEELSTELLRLQSSYDQWVAKVSQCTAEKTESGDTGDCRQSFPFELNLVGLGIKNIMISEELSLPPYKREAAEIFVPQGLVKCLLEHAPLQPCMTFMHKLLTSR